MNTDKHTANCYCAHCKCNRAFVFDCIDLEGREKHRCLACGHLYQTISSARVVSDSPNITTRQAQLSPDTLRTINEIRQRGYYVRSQTMGEGGWHAIAAEIKNWRSYWLSAADSNGDHFDDNITAISDKVAKSYFLTTYDLNALEFYSIHELTTSQREIATSD